LPHLDAWLQALLEQLASGVALLLDYGHARREYYHPSRREGTLTCHYRQRVHDDYLWLPGLQDLTAWVDFSAVAEAGRAVGLVPACYATQSAFLLATGLPELFQAQVSDNAGATFKLAQEVKRLTLPGEMGERFKLLAFTRAFDPRRLPWIGIDQSDRL
jgi:SAM-dependent MidA family methyltransferase